MFAILGATGRIGGAVVRQLRQRELPVRAIVRDSTKSEALMREGCEISVADIRNEESLKRLVPEIVNVEGPRRYSVNDVIDIMQRLLGRAVVGQEVARQNGIQLLIAAGLGESYAQLVTEMWDAHNAGKIELEPGGEVRCGTTSLGRGAF